MLFVEIKIITHSNEKVRRFPNNSYGTNGNVNELDTAVH